MISAKDILEVMRKNDIKVDIEHLNYKIPLKDQDLDSLDLITILFAIEELYQLKITEEEIDEGMFDSINAMVDYININKGNINER